MNPRKGAPECSAERCTGRNLAPQAVQKEWYNQPQRGVKRAQGATVGDSLTMMTGAGQAQRKCTSRGTNAKEPKS